MDEETPKFSDSSFISKNQKNQEFSIQRSPNISGFGRFVQKINELIKRQPVPSKELRLTGRIHQLQTEIDYFLNQLLLIREELENEVDPRLPSLINVVVDPLIKEINRLRKIKQIQNSAAQQVKESKECAAWIEKAKMWVDLCAKRHQHEADISKAIIEYTIQEFHARIDRDLQVIQDYLNHTLENLKINDLLKSELRDRLEPELSQHLFELYLLKDHPKNLSIDTFSPWRADADLARENYFSAALHTIDTIAGEFNPHQLIEDVVDHHSIEIQITLTALEDKVGKMEVEIGILADGSEVHKNEFMFHLVQLEKEAHHLNGDLRLSHEHAERVQQILDTISGFKNQLE